MNFYQYHIVFFNSTHDQYAWVAAPNRKFAERIMKEHVFDGFPEALRYECLKIYGIDKNPSECSNAHAACKDRVGYFHAPNYNRTFTPNGHYAKSGFKNCSRAYKLEKFLADVSV